MKQRRRERIEHVFQRVILLFMSPYVLPVLISWSSAQAACPSDPTQLERDLDAAMSAFEALEDQRFLEKADHVLQDVRCLTERVPPPLAVRVHEVNALRAAIERDRARAVAAFRAVLAGQPDYALVEETWGEGTPQRGYWAQARISASTRAIPLSSARWYADGRLTDPALAGGRAWIAQRELPDGGILSWYLDGVSIPESFSPYLRSHAASTPVLDASPAAESSDPVETPSNRNGKPTPSRLAILGAGTTALVSGALLTAAAFSHRNYFEEPDPTEAEHIASRTNAAGTTGIVLGAAAGGLTVFALWKGKW